MTRPGIEPRSPRITQRMKRYAIIHADKAKDRNLEIANFLKVDRSFVYKIRNELQVSGKYILTLDENKHSQYLNTIRTPECIQQV